MTNDLKQHLLANPQLKTVYVNENGEWQFHKRAGYDKELSREEILKMRVTHEPAVEVKKDAPAATPGMSADDIAKIKEQLKAELLVEIKATADAEAAEKAKSEKEAADKAGADKTKNNNQQA
ncbi:hypothetical protein J3L18_31005 [Mucilaginibacter gossypii]|uniref:hypothetical protein n=1 Tax=Mucilaginibacter gossypii TaxID=551996 RepID=UPI000DCF1986|nr:MULTISPECIES: hypothetical protein [Mucilaginibacter]QTE37477.1 hypothetical protein J3L18_31005 [Mucilaginibacter gossypii]RAV52303.1 hypothetical protein DIU36_24520 [Mucilaginibacter rubeus]